MKYNTDINVLGGVPDYPAMIRFVADSLGSHSEQEFAFRTENATKRFVAAIERSIISCKNDEHKKLFFAALESNNILLEQKYMVIFWQLIVNNELFREITLNYYLRMLYAGRVSLSADEILSFIYELRRANPDEFQWSEATLKINASKYLTLLKKVGLAEGDKNKTIRYQNIGDDLFIYLVRLSQIIYPDDKTIANPLLKFAFLDEVSLINRLKAIRFTELWTLTQLGNQITIEITPHE